MSFHSLLHDFHNKFQSKMLRAVLTSAITLGGAMALAGTAAAGASADGKGGAAAAPAGLDPQMLQAANFAHLNVILNQNRWSYYRGRKN